MNQPKFHSASDEGHDNVTGFADYLRKRTAQGEADMGGGSPS